MTRSTAGSFYSINQRTGRSKLEGPLEHGDGQPIPFHSLNSINATAQAASLSRSAADSSSFQTSLSEQDQAETYGEESLQHQDDAPISDFNLEAYTQPFVKFMTENPTAFHAVETVTKKLEDNGFVKLSERESWDDKLHTGGKFYSERNGSTVIAFAIGKNYKAGNGASVVATHIDAITTKLKPISNVGTKAGFVQLGVAPYAGGLNGTWWDRDLGIGGRVLVRDGKTGKIQKRLVKLGWPIARIPTLAPHFGASINLGQANKETEMVPIIGLDNAESSLSMQQDSVLGGIGTFTATQPPRLVRAIAGELGVQSHSEIINWDLELYDIQPAQLGGLDKEFIFAGRIDDKLCSFSAIEALIAADLSQSDSSLKVVGCFDDEEIGSMLRQGAKSNLLPLTLERICESFSKQPLTSNLFGQMYANSFLVSADVSHAVNPNFLGNYLQNHAPRLNVGVAAQTDPNGNDPTDAVSMAFLQRVADKCGATLQVFQIRNDSRSGSTVGPMLSSATGMRAVDAGMPQLSMHSIRATTGSLDPGLGVQLFKSFFENFEAVDAEFK